MRVCALRRGAAVMSATQETVDAMRDGNQSLHYRLADFASRLESFATRLNAIVDAALEPSPPVGGVAGLHAPEWHALANVPERPSTSKLPEPLRSPRRRARMRFRSGIEFPRVCNFFRQIRA